MTGGIKTNKNITDIDALSDTFNAVESVEEIAPEKRVKKTFSFVGKERMHGRGMRGRGRKERLRSDLAQAMISLRRVARVVAGGRRFSFSAVIVAGDRNGKVGVGVGKAGDTSLAIEKALKQAKRNIITVAFFRGKSISHEIKAKYSSTVVYIKPAIGRGMVAGSSARTVLDLAGVTDVIAKVLTGSKNKLNIARATIVALSQLAGKK
ncbi:MAG TPA: 30S ribosomal protein S5 [Candidatus Paceibacterota bacterium]